MDLKFNFTSLKNFVFLYIVFRSFVSGVEEFLIQPTAWYYIKSLGESNLFLGITMAIYSVGALMFSPIIGALDVRFQAPKMIFVTCTCLRFIGNLLYSIPVNGYFPLFGRFICGLAAATDGVMYGVITKGTTYQNRSKAFLYFDGIYCLGTICGPILGSVLTFKFCIYGWKIYAGICLFNLPLILPNKSHW